MPFGWRITVLLLLLLPAVTLAQSGDGDTEPRISCTSHISLKERILTCKLFGVVNYNEDDEDGEDSIERMAVCYKDLCLTWLGDTINSTDLSLVRPYNLTVHLKSGRIITNINIQMTKIVKPRSPRVCNVTFSQEFNQAVFHIQIPYLNDYVRVDNLQFELQIWTDGSKIFQNVSQKDTLEISTEHLQGNRTYHVRVRAIPYNSLRGTWSDWSETLSFFTPDWITERNRFPDDQGKTVYKLIVCLVPLAVLIFSMVFFWKNKIFTYMWPSIPHPKHTLVQICNPNKGLLLNFKPEVFSALKIYPLEKATCEETEPSIASAAADGTNAPSSTQSSGSSRSDASVSTEESELLSRSSSDGEDSLQSSGPSPMDVPWPAERPHTPTPEHSAGRNEPELFAVSKQEEAYVTMSSFYQIS